MLQLFDTLYSFDYDGDLSPYLAAEEKEDYQMALDHQRRAQASWSSGSPGRSKSGWETLLCNQEEAGEERERLSFGGDWCWGSSWGRWRGGRNFAARRRGTAGGPGVPPLRNSGGASGFAVGADDLGGPRAHTVRPYREEKGARRE